MAQVYFHCSNSREVRIDRSGEAVSDLAEARDRAAGIVRSLIMGRDAEDWRDWVVHVSDDFDEEISFCRSPSSSANRIEEVAMLPARPPFMPLLRRLDAIVARCHRLIERARDPYRPERHYMRGPGPNGTPGIALTSQALPSRTRPTAHPARSAPDRENPLFRLRFPRHG